MSDLWITSHAILWLVVLVQGVLLVAMMRQVGSLLLRVGSVKAFDAGYGADIGDAAPWLPDGLAGQGKGTLIAFLSTTCGTCDALVPAINATSKAYHDALDTVVVARDRASAVEKWRQRKKLRPRVLSSEDAFTAFGVDGTPYVYVVDAAGVVRGHGGVNHIEQLEALVRGCGMAPRNGDGSQSDAREPDLIPLIKSVRREEHDERSPI